MKPLLPLTLTCCLACASLTACSKKENTPPVAPSKPLPEGLTMAFKRHAFDHGGPLRPYEPAMLILSGPGLQDRSMTESLWLDPDSRVNGQPIREDLIKYLTFGGVGGPEKHQRYRTLSPEFQPWALLPRRPGTTTFNLVVHTSCEKWVCPPVVLEIAATEDEVRLIDDFEESGARQFLDHAIGARRADEPNAPPPAYGALNGFMERHPNSYLAEAIRSRARRLFLEDVNSISAHRGRPLLAEDREALAKLLGRFDPRFPGFAAELQGDIEEHRPTTEKPDALERRIALVREWRQLAEAAAAEASPGN